MEEKLTFLYSLLLKQSSCVVTVFCGSSGLESASLKWDAVRSERIHSPVFGVSKWIKMQSWPSRALASAGNAPAWFVCELPLGSLKPAAASILRAPV